MYINILNLLWIVPVAAAVAVFALAMVRADSVNDESGESHEDH